MNDFRDGGINVTGFNLIESTNADYLLWNGGRAQQMSVSINTMSSASSMGCVPDISDYLCVILPLNKVYN